MISTLSILSQKKKKFQKKYIEYFFSFEVRNKLNMKNIYNTSNAEEID